MINPVDRKQALQYALPAHFVAMVQRHQIGHALDFISSHEEETKIRNVYDMAAQWEESANDVEERVFLHPEDDLMLYPALLSNALSRFFAGMDVDSFFVLPHLKLSIVGVEDQDNLPLQRARQLLLGATGDKHYDEAYKVDSVSFEEVIQALFWIIRYDATVPEHMLIYPESADYFITLCKYGNLHFHIKKKSKPGVFDQLRKAGLKAWEGQEFDRFSHSYAIEGRFTSSEE